MQVILYFIPMFCTPIFIHGFVVFVRLYWFERRFQNIVRDARNFRRSRSRTKTDPKETTDSGSAEKGIRGRSIVVLHNRHDNEAENEDQVKGSRTTSESSQLNKPEDQSLPFHRDITFADEIEKHDSKDSAPPLIPPQLSPEQHIAIRENQRNPKDKSALRIPGPRDFDRGREPEPLNADDDGGDIVHQVTTPVENLGDPSKRNITIDEPEHPHRIRTDTSTFPRPFKRKSDLKDMANAPTEELAPPSTRLRTRTGTFSSLKNWASHEQEPATPYLSWQPTIGRNSAFVDLTEEQREELGGIEYRSLKTLAVVLICKLCRTMPSHWTLLISIGYYTLYHLLGIITLLPWIVRNSTWGSIVQSDGVSKVWWYDLSLFS